MQYDKSLKLTLQRVVSSWNDLNLNLSQAFKQDDSTLLKCVIKKISRLRLKAARLICYNGGMRP